MKGSIIGSINLLFKINLIIVPPGRQQQKFKNFQTSVGGTASAESMRNKRRVVSLVTLVTAMFALSWLPIQLILLLKSVGMYKVTIFNISIQVTLCWKGNVIPFVLALKKPNKVEIGWRHISLHNWKYFCLNFHFSDSINTEPCPNDFMFILCNTVTIKVTRINYNPTRQQMQQKK